MNNIFGPIEFGGSGMIREVYDFICNALPRGYGILELGSGHISTPALGERYRLTSVEENEDFLSSGYRTHYIYCPVSSHGWYNRAVLKYGLGRNVEPYEMIIVDGPANRGVDPNISATGFYDNRDLFNLDGWILIDDVYRDGIRDSVLRLANELGRGIEWIGKVEGGWQTAAITPK